MTAKISPHKARPCPEWFAKGVIYQVWLRSFTPEGTLAAAARRLVNVADLGANVIYLSPIMLADPDTRREFWSVRQKASVANNPRNPYRTSNFNLIDPEYGNEADLRAFMGEAHRLGLKVLMDLVYHHTGPTCDLLQHPGYYQMGPDGRPLVNNWNFLKLNLANPGLRRYLIDDMRHWLSFHADGFRLDVSGAVPLDFWVEARRALEPIKPDLVMLAENEGLADEQHEAFDASYSFGWYDRLRQVVVDGADASILQEHHERLASSYPPGARFIRYSDNHDLHRADVVFGEAATRAIAVLHFAMDGIPFIYNGQEIGDTTPQDLFSHWPIRWETGNTPGATRKRGFFQTLARIRRGSQSPAGAEFKWVSNDCPNSALSFMQQKGETNWVTIINLSNRPLALRLNAPEAHPLKYQDLMEVDKTFTLEEGKILSLPAFGAVWGVA